MQDVDYLIVGAGAIGLAFADTVLSETDATIAIVDRNEAPGGHWNFAYDFVRLHQPSEFYGVESIPLGKNVVDSEGWNAGYYPLATRSEILDYYRNVLKDHLLPTGRVTYFPRTNYLGQNKLRSLANGEKTELNIRRKVVDATYFGTTIPALHQPSFTCEDGVHLIAPNEISERWRSARHTFDNVCILGAGKTGMDVGVHLLELGLERENITWVKPRESWMMNRATVQPGAEFFESTLSAQASQMRALAAAESAEDLFLRLERDGVMLRIDRNVVPDMYHCAIISEGEVALLQRIETIVRLGHVRKLTPAGMEMTGGVVPMHPETLYIDCTASAVTRHPQVPIFRDHTITLQITRACQPTFSAALIGAIEALPLTDEEKNNLCQPLPLPDTPKDFFAVSLTNMMNQYVWTRTPNIRDWLMRSRLDGFTRRLSEVTENDVETHAILNTFRRNTPDAIANIQRLMMQPA